MKRFFSRKAIVVAMLGVTSVVIIVFQNCSRVKFQDSAEFGSTVSGANFCELNPSNPVCSGPISVECSFNGIEYSEGQVITAYQNSSVGFNQKCLPEQRVCRSGSFTGTYNYPACTPDKPMSCTFNGVIVKHGESVFANQNSSVPFGETCVSEKRVCTDGALSGSFNFASCGADLPRDCLFDGKQIKHGAYVTAYYESSVPYGSRCSSQAIQCLNGSFAGTARSPSCVAGAAKSCTFDGKDVAHGEIVKAYPVSTVPFGQLCKSENRACDNGKLLGAGDFASCTPGQPASCTFLDRTLAHGEKIVTFEKSSVLADQKCQSEERECLNGELSGAFQEISCEPDKSEFKEIPVATGSAYSPFKLLIVVDNSYTMSQAQDQVANNLDSLLLPLAGRDVDVKIITTTDSYDRGRTVFTYTKTDGTQFTDEKEYGASIQSASGYTNSIYPSITVKYYSAAPDGQIYSLKASDTAEQTALALTAMKNYIRRIGTNGSDAEKVFCPISRELHDPGPNAFFKPSEKAAIVVLTDEDDSSTNDTCKAGTTETYGAPISTTTPAVPDMTRINVTVQYWKVAQPIIKDGITIGTTTAGWSKFGAYVEGYVSLADYNAGLCATKALPEIRVRYPQYNNQMSITSCKTEIVIGKPAVTEVIRNSTYGPNDFNFYSGISRYNPAEFDNATVAKAKNLFGSNFFMGFIINKTDGSCVLKSGQSVGSRYQKVVTDNPTQAEAHGICAATYEPALKKVSEFIVEVALTSYPLDLPLDARVIAVELLRDGVTTVLLPTSYSIEAGRIILRTTLKAGDKIVIKYAPR